MADEPRPHADETGRERDSHGAERLGRRQRRGQARSWARPPTCRPSRPAATSRRSTSGPTFSGWGRSCARSSTGRPAYVGPTYDAIERKAKRGDTAEALRRLDVCGADGELVALRRDCLAVEPLERPREAGELARRITAYVAGVQERLRSAELARAAEEARAEEAIATAAEAERARAAEEARAEEERRGRVLADQLAGEAEARARSERKRRRATVGLAASVLAFAGLGGGTWLIAERSRVERYGAAAVALDEAKRLHSIARDAQTDDPGRWADAMAALENAEGLLAQGGDAEQKRAADALKATLTSDRETARNEGEWRTRLVDIRSTKGGRPEGSTAEVDYAAVFREVGIDPDTLSAEVAAERHPIAEAKDSPGAGRRARRLGCRATHPDKRPCRSEAGTSGCPAGRFRPLRNRLRAALDQPGGDDRLKSLRELADSAQVEELPPVSLDLLGVSLLDEGDANAAAEVLRNAQRVHPTDGWLKYNLARSLHKLGKTEEAIRYFMAARTIHPETAHDLAHVLERRMARRTRPSRSFEISPDCGQTMHETSFASAPR